MVFPGLAVLAKAVLVDECRTGRAGHLLRGVVDMGQQALVLSVANNAHYYEDAQGQGEKGQHGA